MQFQCNFLIVIKYVVAGFVILKHCFYKTKQLCSLSLSFFPFLLYILLKRLGEGVGRMYFKLEKLNVQVHRNKLGLTEILSTCVGMRKIGLYLS